MRRFGGVFAIVLALASCRFDSSYRDIPDPSFIPCSEGVVECGGGALTKCVSGVRTVLDDCAARSLVCAPTLLACTPCLPNEKTCDQFDVVECSADGQVKRKLQTCDGDAGFACREGACVNLCDDAAKNQSNVGCEYWPVDLDNAVTNQGNAALQQYAVIVSNPQPDLVARVTIEEDTALPGQPPNIRVVSTATVGIRHLEVFRLGPKEVDGSLPDQPNSGTHTALTRGAFRIRSDVPIVAYQFNPLENVNVFSNEASLLLPTAALGGSGRNYVVAGWPQTIARSENPNQDFGTDLRAFLTIVGTRPDTIVKVRSTARVLPGGPLTTGIPKDGEVQLTLQPFEVMNLETGDFNADFTGTTIDSNAPVAVYVGNEASDAPYFQTLSQRACCADHLEEQLTPNRAVGKRYAIGRMPNRSKAVIAAGGAIGVFDEPEYYRIVAVTSGPTAITTTLPPPWSSFVLEGEGATQTLPAYQDFLLTSSEPVHVLDVQASQEAAGIPRGLTGGDPSITFLPPVEQWRSDYTFLTPDKYSFDYVVITVPFGGNVFVDGLPIDGTVCETGPGDGLTPEARKAPNPPFVVYRCQLSFPVVDPTKTPPNNILPGRQNDGVHRVQADFPIGIVVYGFDSFVSYAYAGGTQLLTINVR